jgi:hypothetical protein
LSWTFGSPSFHELKGKVGNLGKYLKLHQSIFLWKYQRKCSIVTIIWGEGMIKGVSDYRIPIRYWFFFLVIDHIAIKKITSFFLFKRPRLGASWKSKFYAGMTVYDLSFLIVLKLSFWHHIMKSRHENESMNKVVVISLC